MKPNLATQLFNTPWLIHPPAMHALLATTTQPKADMMPMPGDEPDDETEPDYEVENGIACISICGVLVKKENWFDELCGLQSYEELTERIEDAVTDPNVKGILLDIDSPGGQVAGMFDLADFIYSMRGQKPIYAIANDSAYSAAYCLGSAAERLYVTRDGGVGSIGSMVLHCDQSKFDKAMGLDFEYVFSGAKKVDGNPHAPLGESVRAELQARVDEIRNRFAANVARNRSVSADALLATEAGCFYGTTALPLLADQMGTRDDVMQALMAATGTQMAAEPAVEPAQMAEASRAELADLLHAFVQNGKAFNASISRESFAAGPIPAMQTTGIESIDIECMAKTLVPSHRRWEFSAGRSMADAVAHLAKAGSRLPAVDGHFPDGRVLCLRSAVSQYSAKDSRITCRVAPYNSLSCDLGGFREIYQPGCFTESLNAPDDIRVLHHHDNKFVLGCRSAGTARFYDAPDGLHFEADPPKTQWADDLLVSMGRGDIRQGSAAWFCLKDRWERRNGERVRIIEKALLVEASITGFAAYTDTQAAVSVPQQQTSIAASAAWQQELLGARLRLLSA